MTDTVFFESLSFLVVIVNSFSAFIDGMTSISNSLNAHLAGEKRAWGVGRGSW